MTAPAAVPGPESGVRSEFERMDRVWGVSGPDDAGLTNFELERAPTGALWLSCHVQDKVWTTIELTSPQAEDLVRALRYGLASPVIRAWEQATGGTVTAQLVAWIDAQLEDDVPVAWLVGAIEEAGAHLGSRANLRYLQRIIETWRAEGRPLPRSAESREPRAESAVAGGNWPVAEGDPEALALWEGVKTRIRELKHMRENDFGRYLKGSRGVRLESHGISRVLVVEVVSAFARGWLRDRKIDELAMAEARESGGNERIDEVVFEVRG